MAVRGREGGGRDLSWGSLALADRQTDRLSGRAVIAALSAAGKREEERFVVTEEPPKTAGAEHLHSSENWNEACRRHRCLCVKNLRLPCCSHPTCSFFSEVKGCDDQRGSLKKGQTGTAVISNQSSSWLRARRAGASPPSPRPGSAAEGTSLPVLLWWVSQEHL